jgi:hypothetical protein
MIAFFRGPLGISEAAAIPGGVKTATVWFPPKEGSIATGWFSTGSSIGEMYHIALGHLAVADLGLAIRLPGDGPAGC